MKVEVGQRVPMDVVWNVRVRSEEMVAAGEENPYEWQSFSSGDYFAGKRVILFSLPEHLHQHVRQNNCLATNKTIKLSVERESMKSIVCQSTIVLP